MSLTFQPSSDSGPVIRRCAVCGYDLSNVGAGQLVSECPECGTAFQPSQGGAEAKGRGARRWPATWKTSLALSGPMILLGALYALAWIASKRGLGGESFAKELVAILNQCVLPIWFLGPIVGAVILARKYAFSGDRWMVGLGLAVAGIVGNTVMALVAMLAAVFVR